MYGGRMSGKLFLTTFATKSSASGCGESLTFVVKSFYNKRVVLHYIKYKIKTHTSIIIQTLNHNLAINLI